MAAVDALGSDDLCSLNKMTKVVPLPPLPVETGQTWKRTTVTSGSLPDRRELFPAAPKGFIVAVAADTTGGERVTAKWIARLELSLFLDFSCDETLGLALCTDMSVFSASWPTGTSAVSWIFMKADAWHEFVLFVHSCSVYAATVATSEQVQTQNNARSVLQLFRPTIWRCLI